jgi:RHS repeat-associated protein
VAKPNPEDQIISVNDVNEITQISGQPYSYDANGNMLWDGKRNYTWDAENRILGISDTSEPSKNAQFSYDGIGRRVAVAKTSSGGGSADLRRYVWCGSTICQARDAAYAAMKGYFDEGEHLTGVADSARYYGVDQIGSIRRVFQNEASKIDYDPWGVELGATTERADFGYAGMLSFENMAAGLTWYRVYDPEIGRWLSRDPLGERLNDPNTYGYVINNPLTLVDSLGLCVDNGNRPPAAPRSPWDGSYEVAGKGERGYSGSPYGTNNPFKHMRPHPTDPSKVIYKDPQTGKKIIKPMPPGFPGGGDDDD